MTKEQIKFDSFIDSDLFQDPQETINNTISNLFLNRIQFGLEEKVQNYLKNPSHEEIKKISNILIEKGFGETAGLLFNLHRTITSDYSGYSPNAVASKDIETAFNQEIPSKGLIVIDFFVARNMVKTIEICEEKRIDLSRLRFRCPKLILAAQLKGLNTIEKYQFEEACQKLNKSQILTNESRHTDDIDTDEEIALHVSTRVNVFNPKYHGKTVEENKINHESWISKKIKNLAPKGKLHLTASIQDFTPLKAVTEKTKKGVPITKLTQSLTREAVETIFNKTTELGSKIIADGVSQTPESFKEHSKDIQTIQIEK